MDSEDRLVSSIGCDIKKNKIRIGDYDINYITAGHGQPLLLIHGGNIGWGQWYPNLKELSKYRTVYAIDLPGSGRSSKVDYKKIDPERDFFNIVEEFLKRMNWQSFDVAGSSFGGWLAIKLALKFSVVQKLVLVDTVGFSNYMRPQDYLMARYSFARFLSKTVLKPVRENKKIEQMLKSVFFDHHLPLINEFIEYFYETMAESHNILFISRLMHFMQKKRFDLSRELPSLKQDTLIVWGKDDLLMPLVKNKDSFNFVDNVSVKIISHAGHMPALERPEEFNRVILNFFKF